MSDIQQFYKDKNVLLTGGTGFLGKLLIRKLLKTTDVRSIYLIIRPKRGMCVEERIAQLLKHHIFSEVRHKIDKVKAISGDLTELGLGLYDNDQKNLEENVDIIIHCGAHLSMGCNIQKSVFSNVRSTREILAAAKKCKRLVAFLYVSTAYSNCPKCVIEEKFFDVPVGPDLLIKMSEELDEKTLERISVWLRGAWPNNYSFTKAVSESLIKDVVGIIPVGLFRPSIITSTVEEPIKGWTDNIYGPLGILLNINMGILRTIRSQSSVRLDIVPADKVVNAILCTAWEIDQRWKKTERSSYNPPIINFSGKDSSTYVNLKYLRDNTKIALKSAIWYPICFLIYNPILFVFLDSILHRLPYYALDKIAVIRGKKPVASRLFNNVAKACKALYIFMTNEWEIENHNAVALWNKLSVKDKELYNFDVTGINCDEYFQSVASGLKRYIAKEDIDDIAKHEKKMIWLKIIHFSTVGTLVAFFFILATFSLMFLRISPLT